MTEKMQNEQDLKEKEIQENDSLQEIQEENAERGNELNLNEEVNLELDSLALSEARIAELETYIAEADSRERDILLRAKAENENIRRRAEQDVQKAHKFALEKFSKDLLSVVDNLERALATLEGADESVKGLVEGVELTYKELTSVLNRYGVKAFGEVGETFNPEMHQAISQQPAEGIDSNCISTVLQKGYILNDRVIRDAMVMVTP